MVLAHPLGVSNPCVSNPGSDAPSFGYRGSQRSPTGETYLNLVQIGGGQNTFGMAGPTGVGENYIVDPAIGQNATQIVASGSFTAPSVPGTYTFNIDNAIVNVLTDVAPAPTPPAMWPAERATADTDGATFSFVVEETLWGDLNCDGVVDSDDIPHFIQALLDPDGYDADHDGDPYAACERVRADMNGDSKKDGVDIQYFVDLLLGV